jgi:pimeloyl-ACP methyl ester carboxylesterase
MCQQSDQKAALACMKSFGTEDFRDDLPNVTVPTLVIHGDGDATVRLEGSGARLTRRSPKANWLCSPTRPTGAT